MRVVNKSRKIISIACEPLLPGKGMDLPEGYDKHPSIIGYMAEGMLVDASKVIVGDNGVSSGLSDEDRAKIAEEAVAKYKEEQAALVAAQAAKDAEIKAVKAMDKDALITKALGMGIEISDSDTKEILKEKIFKALDA